jgi:hypothetical protein
MAIEGIVANVQPSFVPTDMIAARNLLSPIQLKNSYIWKSLLEAGVYVAGGSDSPVEHPSPFMGIHDAMFRSNYVRANNSERKSADMDVHLPEECLSFAQAVWLYTIGGAYACRSEHLLGRIEKGYLADLVIVDAAVLDFPELLHGAAPIVVLIGGEMVYQNPVNLASSGVKLSESSIFKPTMPSGGNSDVTRTLGGPYIPGKGGNLGGINSKGPTFAMPVQEHLYAAPCMTPLSAMRPRSTCITPKLCLLFERKIL